MQKTLSILIPTIVGREAQLNNLLTNIGQQIKKYHLKNKVEILFSKDERGQHTIGHKRNWLYQNATGKWSMCIDDDDNIGDISLFEMINMLEANDCDTLAIWGTYTENGKNPIKFHHSIQYKAYTNQNGFYQRPPNHLNPIRTIIAKQFRFDNINHGEDTKWAMAICQSCVIKSERMYEKMYYYYNYLPNK